MPISETTLGGLTCRVVDTVPDGTPVELVAVFCHGFGASGTDLVPVAGELLDHAGGLDGRIRFVFPAAPLSLEAFGMPGGRAWWYLDLERLNAAIEQGEFRDQRTHVPAELPEASRLLTALVEDIGETWNVPPGRLLLGGFSQGSMLATDVALRLPEAPAALCIWSGTLLCEAEWRELASHRAGLKVLQSHGRLDPLLPFAAAEWLRDLMTDGGLDVEFIEFPGVHTIPAEAIERTAALLESLIGIHDGDTQEE